MARVWGVGTLRLIKEGVVPWGKVVLVPQKVECDGPNPKGLQDTAEQLRTTQRLRRVTSLRKFYAESPLYDCTPRYGFTATTVPHASTARASASPRSAERPRASAKRQTLPHTLTGDDGPAHG
eukprot:4956918-Prymnesium_polylepis.1